MPIPMKIRDLSRSKLRYRLYRLQNEKPVDANDGIKEFFEGQEQFDGWHNFAITWDVGKEGQWPTGHWVAINRKTSIWKEWDKVLSNLVEDFPAVSLFPNREVEEQIAEEVEVKEEEEEVEEEE